MKKSLIFQTGFGLLLLLAILLMACDKHVTSNKVERKLTKDQSWAIGTFDFMDTTVAHEFANYTFGFGETGSIRILEDNSVSGNWIVGENNDPTKLYISAFVDSPFVFLNDDWTVTRVSGDLFTLESQNGSYLNTVHFSKVEE